MTAVSFTVLGTPIAQGSKSTVRRPNGTTWTAESGGKEGQERHRSWRAEVTDAARAVAPPEPFAGPVAVTLRFCFLPVASDPYRTYHISSPDIDKLARSVLDALKVARVVVDDSRACSLQASKRYCDAGEAPGVDVTVEDWSRHEARRRGWKKRRAAEERKAAKAARRSERLAAFAARRSERGACGEGAG